MAPTPSSPASRTVSRGKMCFSSHSAANGAIASAVNLRAISWIWSWSSVRSNWLIARRPYGAVRLSARPHPRYRSVGWLLFQQPLELQHVPHGRPLEHPFPERCQVRPLVEADHLLGPAGDDEE